MTTLQAQFRKTSENLDSIRSSGNLPAVFYGSGKETTPISVPMMAFDKAFKEAGESSTIHLVLPDGELDVLIHEVQLHPVKHVPIHADFLVVDMNKPIEVAVPLEFVGVSPAVKGNLGVLTKVIHELEVRGLPKNIPHQIEVDISSLETLENQIHVKDIKLPSGVEAMIGEDEVVALVSAVKEEVEETAPMDLSTIEAVDQKGKKEEEGGDEAAAE
ncbi:MAG TPA: 50S ribosomal protein L25 [Candidatus Paceibacterota bacterium]|nr:50S ribosomal protein L25 [Candidatus Paceibacterota bacterium]